MAEDPGGVADRLLALIVEKVMICATWSEAVLLGGVTDHLAPVPLVEVHVDVGHLATARVEEPLEDQLGSGRGW